MNKLVKILISLPLLMVAFSPLSAALTIEITEGTEGALPIAVVPFDTSKVTT
ncbi:MAG: Tol biopolymer transport system component, partial [Candidatus Azotimanducaceae bacterium]